MFTTKSRAVLSLMAIALFNAHSCGAWKCLSDLDCQLNGVCDSASGSCACDKAWSGEQCGTIVLGPGRFAYGGPDYNVTSWGGGPPVFDNTTGLWNLFVTEIADHCGLSEWQTRSTVIRATSDRPDGPAGSKWSQRARRNGSVKVRITDHLSWRMQ